jgi:hypothetical protein
VSQMPTMYCLNQGRWVSSGQHENECSMRACTIIESKTLKTMHFLMSNVFFPVAAVRCKTVEFHDYKCTT